MARAPVRTPGKAATAEETQEIQPELDTGVGSEPVQQVNQSEQDQTDPAPKEQRTDQLDQILQNQIRIEYKLDQLLKSGGIEAPKKQRWVEGKHGLELREVK